MPDGQYRVRLIADDSRDNPDGLGLSDRRLGELFRIDNTRPAVRGFDVERTADRLEVEFEATDPGGTIAAVEFALDGGASEQRLAEEPEPARVGSSGEHLGREGRLARVGGGVDELAEDV